MNDDTEYVPKPTPVPPGVRRRLSATMLARYADSLKRLEQPARRIDALRAKTRQILTPEERNNTFDRAITGEWDLKKIVTRED